MSLDKILVVEQTGKLYGFLFHIGDATPPVDPPPPPPGEFPTSLTYNYQGGNDTLTLALASNVTWTVLQIGAWFTVSQMTGSGNMTIQITAPPNTAMVPRSGSIEIQLSNGDSHVVTLSQGTTSETLLVNGSWPDHDLYFQSNLSGHFDFPLTVTSNTLWMIEYWKSDSWYSYTGGTYSGNQELDILQLYHTINNLNFESLIIVRLRTLSGTLITPSIGITVTQSSGG